MSVRAAFISFVMKHTIKKQMGKLEDVVLLREQMSGSGLAPATPPEVALESVSCSGVNAEWVTWTGNEAEQKEEPPAEVHKRVLLYFHGGGYVFGGPDSHRDLAWRLAREAGLRVLVVDYRLAPEHTFPAAVEDATTSYRFLLDNGYEAQNIVIGGDSAGGGLATALLVNLKNLGLPQPAKAVLISPWVDLAQTGQSMVDNADVDAMLSADALTKMAAHYLGGRDPRAPLASPLYADLSELPPVMVLVGSTEVLLNDATRLTEKIEAAGGQVELTVWPKMPHVFPLLAARIPEGKKAISDIARFIA